MLCGGCVFVLLTLGRAYFILFVSPMRALDLKTCLLVYPVAFLEELRSTDFNSIQTDKRHPKTYLETVSVNQK